MFFPVLVLDIYDNGLEFVTAAESKVHRLHEGAMYQISWPKNDIFVLFIAKPDSIEEKNQCPISSEKMFFGINDIVSTNARFLQVIDTNSDSLIDVNDEIYNLLRVWYDRNKDGICTFDEVRKLSDFGITLHLDFKRVFSETSEGNIINYEITYGIDYLNRDGERIKRDDLKAYDISLQAISYK